MFKIRDKNTPWRRTTGPTWRCSLQRHHHMPPQPLTNYRSFLSMLVQVSCEMAALKLGNNGICIRCSDVGCPHISVHSRGGPKVHRPPSGQQGWVLLNIGPCILTQSDFFFTEHANNPFIITFVARLWGIVGKHDVSMHPARPYDHLCSSEPPLFHSLW